MSDHGLLGAMLAGRRLLNANPRLFDWSRETWGAWLDDRRGTLPDMGRPPVIAVATLTCLQDVFLHLGLMQLLAVPGIRCTPVFRLPTEAAAWLMRAQARREGWGPLVHIYSETECARVLDSGSVESPIFDFQLPRVLQQQALHDTACSTGCLEPSPEAVTAFLSLISGAHPEAIPVLDSPEFSSVVDNRRVESVARLDDTGLDLPEVGQGDELIVTTLEAADEVSIVVRQLADACDPNLLRIRMPASLLTTEAQPIRVEHYRRDGSVSGRDVRFQVPPSQLEPWMLAAFLNRGGAGNTVIRAFASGIGCRIGYAEDEPTTLADIPVVWGVLRDSDRILAQAKAQGLNYFYIDHAYFNRGHGRTYRITRNGYEAGPVRESPRDRLSALKLNIRPWQKSGREILVCPPTEYFMEAHGCRDWLEMTLAEIRHVTDRPVVVRTKPQPGQDVIPLEQALESAHALVTHSSNVAIEAACFGTPVFVAPMSAAAPVGKTSLSEIECPIYPDREPWLRHLAYNQFSFEEIADGTAWRLLLELEQRSLV